MSHQKSIGFVMSDFLDDKYEDSLKVIGKKHDVIGLKVYDKMDMQLPEIGMLQVEDLDAKEREYSVVSMTPRQSK